MIGSLAEWTYILSLSPFVLTFTDDFGRMRMNKMIIWHRFGDLMYPEEAQSLFPRIKWWWQGYSEDIFHTKAGHQLTTAVVKEIKAKEQSEQEDGNGENVLLDTNQIKTQV